MQLLFQFLRTVRLGVKNIRMHKLRSGLTALGIVFGVCSVIIMLSIGEGASRAVQDQIRRLGSQNIIVKSVKPPDDPAAQLTAQRRSSRRHGPNFLDYGLRYADAERLAATLPSVDIFVPIKARASVVRYGTREAQANIVGTVPWYPKTMDLTILPGGRFISALDMHDFNNVCVVGQKLSRQIFLFEDPVGKKLKIGNFAYWVIGVIEDSGGGVIESSHDLPSQTADVFMPLTTLRAYEGDLFFQMQSGGSQSEYVELHELIFKIKSEDDDPTAVVMSTARIIEKDLQRTHGKIDFEVIVPAKLLAQARRTQAIFSIVLGSIAAISLLVGGIGIMNIMLASVTERTREIGIRRALGARRSDIMMQFLIECVILSVGGGVIGMGIGAIVPGFVTDLSARFGNELPTVFVPQAFVLAFVVSVLVGIVFGIYPARRAAMMDPIDALRHE